MNYNWNHVIERGQNGIGFIDVYELLDKNRAIAIIHYLPQHTHKQKRVVVTLLLEGLKKDVTDGMLSNIFQDIEDRITNIEDFKFNSSDKLAYMDTQMFFLKSIDGFEYLNHGDSSFE